MKNITKANISGFTLIELLVVVLIIGVLAAVALPQYQTAINKSRYAGLMPLARSVKDAEEEIFMTKADYTADLGDLAVAPGNIDENNTSTATQGNITLSVVAGASEGQDYVKAVDNRNTDNTFIMYFAKSPVYAGEIHCEAKTSNAKAQQLCKSYGPVGTITNGADTTGTFTTYVLQGTGQNAEQSGGGIIGSMKDTVTALFESAGSLSNAEFENYFDASLFSEWGIECNGPDASDCQDENFHYSLSTDLTGKNKDKREFSFEIQPLDANVFLRNSGLIDWGNQGYTCWGSQEDCDTYFAGQYDDIELEY